jgi:integrase
MEIEAMRSQKVRLSKATVAEAQPAEREYVMWDDRIDGFGLRVRPTGNKSFVFVYRTPGGRAGKVRRVTFKAIDLDTAYKKATALAGHFYAGRDPAADKAAERDEVIKARKVMTVANVLDRFISDHAKTNLKAKTWTEYERLATKLIKPAIGTMKIDTLEPKYVAAMYNQLNATPTQATLAVRVLSSAMSWAEENGLRKHGQNPARIRLKGTRRRQRLFSDREVSRLLTAIDEGTLSALTKLGLRLLFATGCRAGEVCNLRWSDVDFEGSILRWPDTKTGFAEKPLTGEARKLLQQADRIVGVDWVCHGSDPRKPMRVETLEAGMERIMTEAKIEAGENATLHLIRHWFATKTYTDPSIPLPVQMAIVGHKSVATAMRYAHVTREEVGQAAAAAAKRRGDAVKAASEDGEIIKMELQG